MVIRASDGQLFGKNIAAVKSTAHSKKIAEIHLHVEYPLSGENNLVNGRNPSVWDISVVGEGVEARAGTPMIGITRFLKRIVI